MATLWVTGAGGFVGGWLRAAAEEAGHEVVALLGPGDPRPSGGSAVLDLVPWAVEPQEAAGALQWDLLPAPDALIHLAAMSSPPECENRPQLAQAVNVDGPRAFFAELFRRHPDCGLLQVSSGQVYRPAAAPLTEDEELVPVNVYGRTKLDAEAAALAFAAEGRRVTVVRPFNHSGPGQAATFALPSFALRLAALEAAGGGTLGVGRLDAVRDFLHVREVAATYLDLLPHLGEAAVLNVCSGVGRPMQAFLDEMLAQVTAPVELEQESARLRGAADADRLVGDPTRLRAVLGRVPTLEPATLVADLLADARARHERGEDLSRA
jgi:GDP-4-dehydro-6-deoxy-D-mannose reductase